MGQYTCPHKWSWNRGCFEGFYRDFETENSNLDSYLEAFLGMRRDLDTERRAMENIWSKREKQIERAVLNIAGIHGDLEGMVGSSLPAVKLLELPAGPDNSESTRDMSIC